LLRLLNFPDKHLAIGVVTFEHDALLNSDVQNLQFPQKRQIHAEVLAICQSEGSQIQIEKGDCQVLQELNVL
jgi:hypothetical protein